MSDLPITFDENGLIPVVVQDNTSDAVLMLAYMNREALDRTRETGRAHFWSRSRKTLWKKGETSGHEQIVKSIHVNCYANSLLVKVDQIGACCHTGFPSCYYRELTTDNQLIETESRRFDPADVYGEQSRSSLPTWIGAYRWLSEHDFVSVSGTSRLLRESSVPVLSARVADELRELAGVLTGEHQHENPGADTVLEGSQVLYWLALTAIRAGLSDEEIVEAIELGAADGEQVPATELPAKLRNLADEWQRSFFRSIATQLSRTAALVSLAAQASGTSLAEMIKRDLSELRGRTYLAEYFAGSSS